ncbi:helix-turn-helix domain-containing protein [Leucobacter sp. OH1287]|uniref:helix-turn-helix domain-containing protein n=1 Tax=Leucobacter sp. OH1287 TaxID=2491049 RepID=UPI000F5F1334|nr:helix-turn-helix domain-containing protein [Leucobacter sp. OH1287]RRD59532.1 helix-turn-helix domain-containing protein [Leucobacter sp. OH1287]
MSSEATRWAVQVRWDNMLQGDRIILFCLADWADETGICFPTRRLIAEVAMCSVSTVKRAIERFETLGIVARATRYAGKGRQTSNKYQLNMKRVDFRANGDETLAPVLDDSEPVENSTGEGFTLDDPGEGFTLDEPPSEGEGFTLDDPGEGFTLDEPGNIPKGILRPQNETPPFSAREKSRTPKNKKPTTRQGTFLAEGWTPKPETIDRMRAECPNVDLQREHQVFTDYWAGVSGARGRKRDWDATWRNWIRRASQQAGTRGYQKPAAQQRMSQADQVIAALQGDQPVRPAVLPLAQLTERGV